MAGTRGVVASGHEETSAAASRILAEGGNAFDACIAAVCASCVSEPLLTSLGGGGFLLAHPAGEKPVVLDFFTQTPKVRLHSSDMDFYPILADFGEVTQEFHIGKGSIAVPGTVAGLFAIHERFGSLPMAEVVAPAVDLARRGVRVTSHQHYISTVLLSILESSPAAMRLVATESEPAKIAEEGAVVCHPEMADTFEALAAEGPALFYQGELGQKLVADCQSGGGQLTLDDLGSYRVEVRDPVTIRAAGGRFAFNPPPSPGGSLLAVAMSLLDRLDIGDTWGSPEHLLALSHVMNATTVLRDEQGIGSGLERDHVEQLLADEQIQRLRDQAIPSALFSRGTTHQSIADEHGNLASLTVSNGEGCSYVLPGSGIMLNNMLGEEDLNPQGFHRWPTDQRLASMMCPTVAERFDGSLLALGSGGSNRIRSALLQVLVSLFKFDMPLQKAVEAPRLHLEKSHLSMEAGYAEPAASALLTEWPDHFVWNDLNIFFGGVHAVALLPDGQFRAVGDPRRGGAVATNA